MPGKIEVVHHTLADWDFEHDALYRALSPDQYVSAPTSLKYSGAPGAWFTHILCRVPTTQLLPQGEVRQWIHQNSPTVIPANFRNQEPLGDANSQNCYLVFITATTWRLHLYVGGVYSFKGETACYFAQNEWIHYSTLWYNGLTPGEEQALCVDVYREVAGEWIKQGDTLYDTSNRWRDSEINRCGFSVQLTAGYIKYHDDTEIWGPV